MKNKDTYLEELHATRNRLSKEYDSISPDGIAVIIERDKKLNREYAKKYGYKIAN